MLVCWVETTRRLLFAASLLVDIVYSAHIRWPYKLLFVLLIAPLVAAAGPVSPVHRAICTVALRVCPTILPRVVITAQGIKDELTY